MRRTYGRLGTRETSLVAQALFAAMLAMGLTGGIGADGMVSGMMGGYGSGFGMMGGGWLAMLLGFLVMLAVIAAVVVGVIWLVRSFGGTDGHGAGQETSAEILRRRLAAGEISHDEYEQVKQTLER